MTDKLRDQMLAVARKTVAWAPMHACYWIGHAASLVINRWPDCKDGSLMDRIGSALYRVYQCGMNLSLALNDWAGFDLWRHADEKI